MKKTKGPISIILFFLLFVGYIYSCGYINGDVRLPSDIKEAETFYAKITAEIELVDIELTKLASETTLTPFPTSSVNSQNWADHFLLNPTCQIPCWENITPSQTDINTAKRIVDSISGVRVIYLEPNGIGWRFNDQSDRSGYISASENGIVMKIDLTLNDDESLNLSEAIESFGEPQTILKAFDCGFIFLYPYQGMLLLAQDVEYCNHSSIDLAPTTKINRIVLFSLDTKDDLLSNFAFRGEFLWGGYKVYDFANK